MKPCRQCGKKAVIDLRSRNLRLCAECFPPKFVELTERSIKQYKMLAPGERVLVAVSGGKDSLSLWYVLNHLGYDTTGLYIDLGIAQGSYSSQSRRHCERMAAQLGRELRVVRVEEDFQNGVPEAARLMGRAACSFCGMVKRYYMNRVALEEGFDAVATGHNLDDEATTLLMNVLHGNWGYIARQAPVLPAREGFVRRVKPFCRHTEKETALFALLMGIEYIEDECPFSVDAPSLFYKDILNRIDHQYPGTKLQFYSEFVKHRRFFEGAVAEGEVLSPCLLCGQPTTGEICAFCRAKEQVAQRRSRLLERVGSKGEE